MATIITTTDAYIINGVAYKRVSRVLDAYFGSFRKATSDEEQARWNEARDKGTETHTQMATYFASGTQPSDYTASMFVRWFRASGLQYVAHEITMHDSQSTIAGTADLVAFDVANNTHAIIDWKRSRRIHPAAFERYMAQLNIYAVLLAKTNPDWQIGRLILANCHDDINTVGIHDIPVRNVELRADGSLHLQYMHGPNIPGPGVQSTDDKPDKLPTEHL